MNHSASASQESTPLPVLSAVPPPFLSEAVQRADALEKDLHAKGLQIAEYAERVAALEEQLSASGASAAAVRRAHAAQVRAESVAAALSWELRAARSLLARKRVVEPRSM
jgi:hypothetical protein